LKQCAETELFFVQVKSCDTVRRHNFLGGGKLEPNQLATKEYGKSDSNITPLQHSTEVTFRLWLFELHQNETARMKAERMRQSSQAQSYRTFVTFVFTVTHQSPTASGNTTN
jgi:hypothetical protein